MVEGERVRFLNPTVAIRGGRGITAGDGKSNFTPLLIVKGRGAPLDKYLTKGKKKKKEASAIARRKGGGGKAWTTQNEKSAPYEKGTARGFVIR